MPARREPLDCWESFAVRSPAAAEEQSGPSESCLMSFNEIISNCYKSSSFLCWWGAFINALTGQRYGLSPGVLVIH